MSELGLTVLAQVRNRVGHLILNRPTELNALSLPMIRLLAQQLNAWEHDEQVLAVVLRSSNDKAFCAGGDIRMLYESHLAGDSQHFVFFEEEYALDQYIHAYPKPVLALMDGFVLGGGMGLVQGAAFRVISERTRMGMPETAIGFYPDVGGSFFLPRLPGKLGFYLALTGCHVCATDALHAGLADYCIASEQRTELDHGLDQMQWTSNPREDVRSLLATLASANLPEAELKPLQAVIDQHFAQNSVVHIMQSLEAELRQPYQAWAQSTLQTLRSRSPLALSATLELMRRGQGKSLAQCFAQESELLAQWFARGDLIEGVRALIVDKDKSPRWQHSSVEQISSQWLSSFFAVSC